MIYAYVGAILISVVLIALDFISIRWMVKRVSYDMKSKTVDLVTDFGNALDEKNVRLAEQLKSMEAGAAFDKIVSESEPVPETEDPDAPRQTSVMRLVEGIASSSYCDSDFPRRYRRIKTGFTYNPFTELQRLGISNDIRNKGCATMLLEKLDIDTVYRLMLLSSEQQKSVLLRACSAEDAVLVEAYCNQNGSFDILRFIEYLKSESLTEPQAPLLTVGMSERDYYERLIQQHGLNIRLAFDGGICEGFTIEHCGKLYDYCIRERELS